VLVAGPAAGPAPAAMILVHGRGGSAPGILTLGTELRRARLRCLAPQATGGSWYPHSFLAPLDANQPGLGSGIEVVDGLVQRLLEGGLESRQILLCGFSQGACLALETAARRPRAYGAVIGLTGGLIGPPGTPRDYPGSLNGTPIYLAAGDPDPHVPWERVEETAEVLARMGAEVELRRFPGMPHTMSGEEVEAVRRHVDRVMAGSSD
jgi:predicted esterase